MRSRVESEKVEGRERGEKKKGRRESGPDLGSPSLLFLGPDVNGQAEEDGLLGPF